MPGSAKTGREKSPAAAREPSKPRRVTIRDVAEAAGVDRSTVSRALTRPHLIRAETVELVRAVASRLGYAPNHMARALSTGRAANFALLVPDLANPFIPPLVAGVQREADLSGYCVFIGNSDGAPEQEARLMSRLAGQVSGTILVASRATEAEVRAFAANGPMVLVNREVEGIPRVLIDAADGIRQAVTHLVGLGHRRLAYVGGPDRSWANDQRRQAAIAAAAAAGADLVPLSAGLASFEAGKGMAGAILGSGTTAAIAFDDLLAQGILAGLAARGVLVPDHYSLVGCDDVLGAVTHPALTSISNRAAEAGRAAVRMLFDRMTYPESPVVRQTLATELVLRRTTAPPAVR